MPKQLINITNNQTNLRINFVKNIKGFQTKLEAITFILDDYWKTKEGKKLLQMKI